MLRYIVRPGVNVVKSLTNPNQKDFGVKWFLMILSVGRLVIRSVYWSIDRSERQLKCEKPALNESSTSWMWISMDTWKSVMRTEYQLSTACRKSIFVEERRKYYRLSRQTQWHTDTYTHTPLITACGRPSKLLLSIEHLEKQPNVIEWEHPRNHKCDNASSWDFVSWTHRSICSFFHQIISRAIVSALNFSSHCRMSIFFLWTSIILCACLLNRLQLVAQCNRGKCQRPLPHHHHSTWAINLRWILNQTTNLENICKHFEQSNIGNETSENVYHIIESVQPTKLHGKLIFIIRSPSFLPLRIVCDIVLFTLFENPNLSLTSTLRFVSFWLASLFWNVFCRISS